MSYHHHHAVDVVGRSLARLGVAVNQVNNSPTSTLELSVVVSGTANNSATSTVTLSVMVSNVEYTSVISVKGVMGTTNNSPTSTPWSYSVLVISTAIVVQNRISTSTAIVG